ncbi:cytochrome B6 [Motiliproteus coralliicola]|uniref:Cytochrome B6 n=1 Tax=Motiliproteus coralliicola TaxID=2283196 RepID=A0A369WV56_9GAMM|nr:cytochrome-c peroxidase [Motiliproteus coralliicola]RDE24434.1 cytochrome B6 [Motiliproteus coralliicola]
MLLAVAFKKSLFLLTLFISLLPLATASETKSEPIKPLVADLTIDPKLVALGDQLFHDPRLSKDNSVSCASCHQLSQGGTDDKPRSSGVDGAMGEIKTPTVFNCSYNLAQFWDGRAVTLEEQAAGPIHNPVEMNSSWSEVRAKLSRDPSMVAAFNELFDDGISSDNIATAIATFERSLVTINSRFDRWLQGENSLTEQELQGYRLFQNYGCISCHQGANVGGNMYAYMGAMGDYFESRNSKLTRADLGRFNVTGQEEDRHYFKVPSLRLAAINPPYFHDGSATTLEEAVRIMGLYQLGREIPEAHIQDIIAFLRTLIGEHSKLTP